MHSQGSHSKNAPATQATSAVPPRSSSPTFLIACWLLALIAFAQLISIAAALTIDKRVVAAPEAALPVTRAINPEPIRPRSIDEILASLSSTSTSDTLTRDLHPDTQSRNTANADSDAGYITNNEAGEASESSVTLNDAAPVTVIGSSGPTMPPRHALVIIANPVVEKLIAESRAHQLDGDMMRAMLKLDEAARRDPSEAAVIYNKGLLYEEMGLYTQAADQYQQVQQMGIVAGTFFKLSAKKLTKGMDAAHAHRPIISIGPMNVRRNNSARADKQVDVAITILARPDKSINPSDVSVQVHFYDKLDGGEIKKARDHAKISDGKWDDKVDWKGASHEETVNISYTIPEEDLAQAHLFGQREFFGYVVELYYQNKVIDQQASPRRLNSTHGNHISPQHHQSLPWLPGDKNSLLPHKDEFDNGNDLDLPRR
ncbi:MAG: hypothetical protein P8P36_11205 [Akkermansiaceae bacterium]|nr:hypothetical protein [Akkermansiaceae bacterium]